jgi:hypothetical protein
MTDNQKPQGPPTPEQIERRAYELYVQRGGQDGQDLEDWLAAERELTEAMRDSAREPVRSPRTRTSTTAAA